MIFCAPPAPPPALHSPAKVTATDLLGGDDRGTVFTQGLLRYTMITDNVSALDDSYGILSAAGTVRGVWPRPLGLAYSSSLELGAALPGGFLYQASLAGGLGAHPLRGLTVGLTVGIGPSGIHDERMPFAWQVPVEGWLGLLAGRAQILGYVRPTWIFGSDERQDGSDLLRFGDEGAVGIAFTWAAKRRTNVPRTRGLTVSLEYREAMDAQFFSFGLGLGSAQPAEP